MHLYKLRWGQGQPLVQRHIGVITTLEHLQEAQGRCASVLDIMTHGERDVTDISGVKVERSRLTRRSKHAHAALAVEVVLPFISVRMPVQFTQSARFDFHESGGDSLGG